MHIAALPKLVTLSDRVKTLDIKIENGKGSVRSYFALARDYMLTIIVQQSWTN